MDNSRIGREQHLANAAGRCGTGIEPAEGFIPFTDGYQSSYSRFPHTMEWSYFPVNAVMTGSNTFNWTTVDNAVNQAAGRGHQTAMRFYLDYPAKAAAFPSS